jgi:epoxyqueuosine reductase
LILPITAAIVKDLARACGFELVGVAAALPSEDFARFETWRAAGRAGEMNYLTDRRGDLRADPRQLLPAAQSIVCVGKLYNTPHARSNEMSDSERGWISRYAWGADYHNVLRAPLEQLVSRIAELHREKFEFKICIDTAPLLERSYARAAGLGWIGKNTCLINQEQGSWFLLAEVLLSIPLTADMPAPERCGTCRRCIEACPTQALVPSGDGWTLDARLCISYLTIEKRGDLPAELAEGTGKHIFGCDICQDICPWNRKAPVTMDEYFGPVEFAPGLERMADLTEAEFRLLFRQSPIWRTKYEGFLRNVAVALGNSGNASMKEPLERLSRHANSVISAAAKRALGEWEARHAG